MSEIQCECGSMVLNMKTHIKTKKHENNLYVIECKKKQKENRKYYGKINKTSCPCGSTVRTDQIQKHSVTLKHSNYLKSLSEEQLDRHYNISMY